MGASDQGEKVGPQAQRAVQLEESWQEQLSAEVKRRLLWHSQLPKKGFSFAASSVLTYMEEGRIGGRHQSSKPTCNTSIQSRT